MLINKTILLVLIIILLLYFRKRKEHFSTKTIELTNTRIKIVNDYLYLINKNDDALYTHFNIKTFKTTSKFYNKIYENLLKDDNKRDILILGFGFGGMPLRMSLENDVLNIDCVDIDNELFKYFKQIFPNYSSKINLFLDNADDFIKKNNKKYDIIIDDVFDGNNKIELNYDIIKSRLNKNGKLYINNYDINKKNIKIVNKILKIFRNGQNKIISNDSEQSVYIFKNN